VATETGWLHQHHNVILPFMGRISNPTRCTDGTIAWILPTGGRVFSPSEFYVRARGYAPSTCGRGLGAGAKTDREGGTKRQGRKKQAYQLQAS
jgi:hypothetical protein